MKYKAVIFDMDGVIIDSEPYQSQAYEQVIRDYGCEPVFTNVGTVNYTIGVKEKDNWIFLKEYYHIDESVVVLMKKRDAIFQKILQDHIVAMPGLLELVQVLKKNNIKIAIASSSVVEHIDLVLSNLGIKDQFDVVLSAFQVKRGKPFPDVYLEAARQLNVEPDFCAVFEDAEQGVKSGNSAGMKVVAVPNEFTGQHDFSKADIVVNSLEDEKVYKFLEL